MRTWPLPIAWWRVIIKILLLEDFVFMKWTTLITPTGMWTLACKHPAGNHWQCAGPRSVRRCLTCPDRNSLSVSRLLAVTAVMWDPLPASFWTKGGHLNELMYPMEDVYPTWRFSPQRTLSYSIQKSFILLFSLWTLPLFLLSFLPHHTACGILVPDLKDGTCTCCNGSMDS